MKVLKNANLVSDDEGKRTLAGPFVGFAVGVASEHDLLSIETDKGTFLLRPGYALPAESQQVIVTAVRKGSATEAPRAWALICFECCDEMAAWRGPRASYILPRAAGTSFSMPFAGRRHAIWGLHNTTGGAITWTTRGRRYYDGTSYDEVDLQSGSLAAGAKTVRHEGGTDHEECFDTMVLVVTGSCNVWGEAVGELGGTG